MNVFFSGVDISAKKLDVAYRTKRGLVRKTIDNNTSGHAQFLSELKRAASGRVVRVVMESTGIYGLELALALDRGGCEVMVANPRATANYGKASMQRSKTDRRDALMLLEFAETMPFKRWERPSAARLELRTISRRVHALNSMLREEKNRMHAACQLEGTAVIRKSIRATLAAFQKQIKQLRAAAKALIEADPVLARRFELLVTTTGIGEVSAIGIIAELAVLPEDMTDRQWVAHTGLDPREYESGTSVHKVTRISKRGNKYLRAALYIPARVACRFDPGIKTYAERLRERGKKPLQIHVAVMRKLLHSIHAMFSNDQPFDSTRFYLAAAGAAETSGIASSAISEVSVAHS